MFWYIFLFDHGADGTLKAPAPGSSWPHQPYHFLRYPPLPLFFLSFSDLAIPGKGLATVSCRDPDNAYCKTM